MFTANAGSGRAALRIALFSLAAALAGCSANTGTSALEVEVVLEAGLTSRCVKVTATDGAISRESKPIPLDGKMSPLSVAVYADGFAQPVTLQALGYSDVGCTMLAPGESSEQKEGTFTSPPSTVTLTLRRVMNDGGVDGGADGGADAGTDAGTDAGFDAGLDLDMDTYPQPADCDDTNPAIYPGATEVCRNGLDDDCDSMADCQDDSCNGATCAGNGTCTANVCVALTEVSCTDGVDNNNNNLVDCADPDCPLNAICDDDNSCTTGERCVADGGCEKVGDFLCNAPPAAQCWVTAGVCVPDAGPMCQYTPMGGSCNDLLGCTTVDTCANGTCSGTPRTCTTPPNSCFQSTGACLEPLGNCSYAPLAAGTGTCNDGQNCTTNDRCAGDGGCAGTPVTCPAPTQCQNASTTCDGVGTCIYTPRTGGACDAGTGAGTCDGTFNCNPTSTSLFPFTPSNFTEAQLPADGGVAFSVTCATTLNTSATPSITNGGCVTMPPFSIITQGGESTVLIRVPSLSVTSGQTLLITGTRPVIFAVTGNVLIDGTIRARNGSGPAACGNGGTGDASGSGSGTSGGGGGGFGTDGGVGGTTGGQGAGGGGAFNGTSTLIPMRGGCNGGNGSANGGAGGGSIQLTASGSITVANTIAAPGRGGTGAAASTGDSGGGGGSGGAILLEGATVLVNSSARITANGGSGGEGSGGSSGNSGLDGNESSSNTTPNGGDNSGNGGNGGVGAGGTTAAGPGLSGGDNNDGSGGGGGGVGRIRINASTSCTIATSGRVVSPPATSNAATGCP